MVSKSVFDLHYSNVQTLFNLLPHLTGSHAHDIGSAVAIPRSEDAKWINGQHLDVSGGINL
jgi:hypothetical protein